MTAPAIAARSLGHRFGPLTALRPFDLELEVGGSLAVLGPNGAGKTTLLRILATASRPTEGTLELFGREARRHRLELRRRLGYLSHQPALYPALTAAENLEFFARLHGLGAEAAAAALRRTGLAAVARRPAGELSRGLQQRVGLARSLVNDPELWIVDEPDASLDADGRDLLAELARGRTVVLATHDQELARRVCRAQLVLKDGAVQRPPIRALEAAP